MNEPMPIYLRAHTELWRDKRRWNGPSKQSLKYPEYALVFDCETLLDTSQALILCGYQICRRDESGQYVCVEEGLVYADGAIAPERMIVHEYARTHKTASANGQSKIRVLNQSKFIENIFYRLAYDAEALVCGFNLPFDLSRLG